MYQLCITDDKRYYILSRITYDNIIDTKNIDEKKRVTEFLHNYGLVDTSLYVAVSVGDNTMPAEVLEELTKLIPNNLFTARIPTCIPNIHYWNIIEYINENYNKDISLKTIASYSHLNPGYISQLFKKESGINFNKYLTDLRINKAKELLQERNLTIEEIATKIGYHDYFYFLKIFKKNVNKTPSEYRQELFKKSLLYSSP
ncbi:helix-turn-helix transcriptional regulator [Anaerocolumna sp.]|uniref:helix-turn-helix transcriptional regulator n=1 Tax=Anaerocolumna sp. TaxID=2041569 RepID=UPI0028A60EB3|nr:AraC family transcriptional regulator [Anaerocolumna sp.]